MNRKSHLTENTVFILGILTSVLLFLLAVFQLLNGDFSHHQHYLTYTQGANLIWEGVAPYEKDFGFGRDFYFYSPAFGISWALGQKLIGSPLLFLALFLSLSTVTCVSGLLLYARALRPLTDSSTWSASIWPFLITWVLLFPALKWIKIEPIALGLLAYSWAQDRYTPKGHKRSVLSYGSAVLSGFVIQWKLQLIPVLGLILVASLRNPRRTGWISLVALGVLLGFLVPFLFLEGRFAHQMTWEWLKSVAESATARVYSMENIFQLIHFHLKWKIPPIPTQLTFALAALTLVIFVKLKSSLKEVAELKIMRLAWALGVAFIVLLGPLHQNNAYILSAPLLLAADSRLNSRRYLGPIFRILTIAIYATAYTWPWSVQIQDWNRQGLLKVAVTFLILVTYLVWELFMPNHET